MAKRIEWHESIDSRERARFWWTQRNDDGVCFTIKKGRRRGKTKFFLYKCEVFQVAYDDLHLAMKSAEAQW